MQLPEFLQQDSDRWIHISGHRIGLEDVVYHYNEGCSPEMLLAEFPTLSLALIHKLLGFYLDNRSEVDAYVTACEEDIERERATHPRGPDLAELRARLQSMHVPH
jgi:uncharacterized protein (DUF433 family)